MYIYILTSRVLHNNLAQQLDGSDFSSEPSLIHLADLPCKKFLRVPHPIVFFYGYRGRRRWRARRAVKVHADLKKIYKNNRDKDQEEDATARCKRRLLLLQRLAWTLPQWQFYRSWMMFSQSKKKKKEQR